MSDETIMCGSGAVPAYGTLEVVGPVGTSDVIGFTRSLPTPLIPARSSSTT